MSTNQLKALRIIIGVILGLLFLQYELGIAVIMSDPAAIPPFSFSITGILNALNGVGGVALPHAILGGILVILSLINMVMAFASRVRRVQVLGFLSFLSIVFAAGGGLFFVLSGFQNDNASHAMATNFIVSFALYFLEFYFLKPTGVAKN